MRLFPGFKETKNQIVPGLAARNLADVRNVHSGSVDGVNIEAPKAPSSSEQFYGGFWHPRWWFDKSSTAAPQDKGPCFALAAVDSQRPSQVCQAPGSDKRSWHGVAVMTRCTPAAFFDD